MIVLDRTRLTVNSLLISSFNFSVKVTLEFLCFCGSVVSSALLLKVSFWTEKPLLYANKF